MATFCLVHGSAQGPTGWGLLVPELERLGHTCCCVQLPTDQADASATSYAEKIADALAGTSRPIVVAHSISGLFLPLVPDYAEVGRLVYLAAVLPLPGETFYSQVQNDPETYRLDFLQVKPPIDDAVATRYLFHDCAPEVIPWALTTVQMMYARTAITETTPLVQWPAVAMSYISCRDDRTINPAWWERAAQERLGVEPIVMEAGHAPFVSCPRELAEILISLATE